MSHRYTSGILRYTSGIHQVYTWSFPHEPPSHFPPHPTPLHCHTAPGLSSLHQNRKFPLALYFTFSNVYVSMLLSPFIPFSLLPLCPQQVCSLCLCFYCFPAYMLESVWRKGNPLGLLVTVGIFLKLKNNKYLLLLCIARL